MIDLGRVSTPILFYARKTSHNGEPDHLPDETLRVREPAVPLHVWW